MVKAVSPKPVNVLVGSDFTTVQQLAELGVRRISVGGALARAAWGGFLQAATNALNSVNDLTTGSIQVEENTGRDQITSQNAKIADEQAKIALLQSNLTAQIVKADAAISALESQLSYVNGLFYSITGNNNNPNGNTG